LASSEREEEEECGADELCKCRNESVIGPFRDVAFQDRDAFAEGGFGFLCRDMSVSIGLVVMLNPGCRSTYMHVHRGASRAKTWGEWWGVKGEEDHGLDWQEGEKCEDHVLESAIEEGACRALIDRLAEGTIVAAFRVRAHSKRTETFPLIKEG